MYCVRCGTELEQEDRFCYKCGAKVEFIESDEENTEQIESDGNEVLQPEVEQAGELIEERTEANAEETIDETIDEMSEEITEDQLEEIVLPSDMEPLFVQEQQQRIAQFADAYQSKKDPGAYEMLFQMEASNVFTRARLMMNRDEDAEDIMYQVFSDVRTRIDELSDVSVFEEWLMKLTRSACLEQLKKSNRIALFSVSDKGIMVEEAPEAFYPDFRPILSMGTDELAANLQGILNSLPESHNICLQMREYDGLSYKDIADELQIPLRQVKNNIIQGRKKVETEVNQRNLYPDAPLAFFGWMLRQGTNIFVCEPMTAMNVWGKLAL